MTSTTLRKSTGNLSDQREIDNYKRQGCNLVPIPKGSGKRLTASWKIYQSEFYTKPIPLDQDFAVILGSISGNLIVIDYDECDDIQELFDVVPNCLDKTLVVRTGDGYHMYLRLNELPPKSNTFLVKGKYKMEVKSTGAYAVGASSDHYDIIDGNQFFTGNVYTRISHCKDIVSLSITYKELMDTLNEKGWGDKTENGISMADFNLTTPTKKLAEGNWGKGSRHNNGWRLALRRFHSNVPYDEVLEEAMRLAKTCDPVPDDAYVKQWVDDGQAEYFSNCNNPENGYKKNMETLLKREQKEDQEHIVGNTAKAIMNEIKFFTTRDGSEELYYFDGMIYKSIGAENLVKEKCENMVEDCTTRLVVEVINKIKRLTYKNRDEINSDPEKIVILNGILNLTTREITSHTPDFFSTILYPVNFSDFENIPQDEIDLESMKKIMGDKMYWDYISSCFTDEKEGVDFESIYTLFEMMSYCLLKDCRFDKAMMLIGQGSNGKTVFIEFMQNMFGFENISNEQLADISEDKFKAAELYGKTCNLYADIESMELSKTGKLKMLISGDRMSAQRKHQQPFTFKNFAKMIFSANRFPTVRDQSNGFFRRFVIVEFTKAFYGKDRKSEYREILPKDQSEKDTVFSLLVYVLDKMIKRGGFKYEDKLDEMRDMWNNNADPINTFINDENELSITGQEDDTVTVAQLYMRYKAWCQERNLIIEKLRSFNKVVSDWFEQTNKSGARRWVGIKLEVKVNGKKSRQIGLKESL